MKRIIISVLFLLFSSTSMAAQAVIFVSLGMPNNALKAYLQQAKHYSIPVVIRGLYTNPHHHASNPRVGSFKDTVLRVMQLVKKRKLSGVSIDPQFFRAFSIKTVPALVIYDDDLECVRHSQQASTMRCQTDQFDVIYGNVPVKKWLLRIADTSIASERGQFAARLLENTSHTDSGSHS